MFHVDCSQYVGVRSASAPRCRQYVLGAGWQRASAVFDLFPVSESVQYSLTVMTVWQYALPPQSPLFFVTKSRSSPHFLTLSKLPQSPHFSSLWLELRTLWPMR